MKPFPRSHIHAERHRLELNEWAVMQASLHFSQEHDGPLGLGKLFTPMPDCNWKSSLSAGGWVTSPTHGIKAWRHFHPGPWSNSSRCWEGNVTGETSFCVQAQTNILQATVGWSSCPRNPGWSRLGVIDWAALMLPACCGQHENKHVWCLLQPLAFPMPAVQQH